MTSFFVLIFFGGIFKLLMKGQLISPQRRREWGKTRGKGSESNPRTLQEDSAHGAPALLSTLKVRLTPDRRTESCRNLNAIQKESVRYYIVTPCC